MRAKALSGCNHAMLFIMKTALCSQLDKGPVYLQKSVLAFHSLFPLFTDSNLSLHIIWLMFRAPRCEQVLDFVQNSAHFPAMPTVTLCNNASGHVMRSGFFFWFCLHTVLFCTAILGVDVQVGSSF